ncbi:MAG: hypothetical protein ACE5JB_12675 [bacterium]
MKLVIKITIILNLVIYFFLALYPIEISGKLKLYAKDSSSQLPELNAILFDSQFDNDEDTIVGKTFEVKVLFVSKDIISLNNWQVNNYLKNNDLQFNFPFIIYKYHPREHTAES